MDELHKYMKNAKFSQTILINEEIDAWKRSQPNKEPEILIDLEHFRNVLAQRDKTGIILGGRYQVYNILFESFIKQLITKKVKLTFFVAAHQTADELSFFIPNMESDYYRHTQLMDHAIKHANNNLNTDKISSTIPITMEHNLIALIKKNRLKYSLKINYYNHVQEIGKYASTRSGNVLAIISNDFNLMLFDGSHQFWYANDIKLVRLLSISRFSRNVLEISTDLNTKQLQLLSVMLGSAYVPSFLTETFLSRLDNQAPNKLQKLANYIKTQTIRNNFNLKQMAKDVLDSNDLIPAIQNGLNCFCIQFSISTPNDDPFQTFCKERNPFIYQLIVDNVYLVKDIMNIDYRVDRSKAFPDLIVPLLQKMLGILFKGSIIKPLDRKICLKFAHDEPFRVVQIPIIYPKVEMPELFDLIFKNRETSHDTVRWSLLAWMFNLNDKVVDELRKLKIERTTVVITICHLLQNDVINVLEADALLYSELTVRERKNGQVPSSVLYPHLISTDYTQIAHLYTKIFVMVNRCLEVCGLNRRTDLIQFNGPFFCITLEKFTDLQKFDQPELDQELSKISASRIYTNCTKRFHS